MTRIILFLLISVFAQAADPNQIDAEKAFVILREHWLKDVVPKRIDPNSQRLIGPMKRYPDGSWVKIASVPDPNRPLNLLDFLPLSQMWPGDPNYVPPPSGYYWCKKQMEPVYHILKCRSIRTSPLFGVGVVWFVEIPASDLGKYAPCPVCLPGIQPPAEPNFAEMLEGVSDPNLIKMLKELEAME